MSEITREDMRERLGNIDQIRNLLFGSKLDEYEQRFDSYLQQMKKIELEFVNFQSEVRDRLTQLQSSLRSEIDSTSDSLEKKLKYLGLTTHEETSRLGQDIKLVDQKHTSGIDSLQKTVNDKANALNNELFKTRQELEEDVQTLKNQVFEDIEQRFSDLETAKVSRSDLAEVLFELCLKIKGSDFVPDLKEAADNQTQTDFLLPEQEPERAQ